LQDGVAPIPGNGLGTGPADSGPDGNSSQPDSTVGDHDGSLINSLSLRFDSTVTTFFPANESTGLFPSTREVEPSGVAEGDAVVFQLSLPVREAVLEDRDTSRCSDTRECSGGIGVTLIDCHIRCWQVPNATYTLTYSSGHRLSGTINRVQIINGGVENSIGSLSATHEDDKIFFFDGDNRVWEASQFDGQWKVGPIEESLAPALADIGERDLFDLTMYWGSTSDPGWSTYHYDYSFNRSTLVTAFPSSD
jgi:hypothetical protein